MVEKLKNTALVFLGLLMVVLLFFNLTLGLDDGYFQAVRQTFGIGSSSVTPGSQVSGSTVLPAKLAVRGDPGLYMACGSVMTEMYYSAGPLLTEALGSVGTIEEWNERDFCLSLSGSCVYFSFSFPVDLGMLEYWHTGIMGSSSDYSVSLLALFSGDDGDVDIGFYDGNTGRCYLAQTAAATERLAEVCTEVRSANACFAFEKEEFHNLLPYEAVFTESVYFPVYAVTVPDFSSESENGEKLISFFGMNPYLAKTYKTIQGDTVYVESFSALQVSKGGRVLYSGTDGIQLDIPDGLSEKQTEAVSAELAGEFLSSVCMGLSCHDGLSVADITKEKDGYTISFERQATCAFLTRQDGYSAVVRIRNGAITEVKLWLCNFSETGSCMILPAELAAATLDGMGNMLTVRYSEQNGVLTPMLWSAEGGIADGAE